MIRCDTPSGATSHSLKQSCATGWSAENANSITGLPRSSSGVSSGLVSKHTEAASSGAWSAASSLSIRIPGQKQDAPIPT